MTQREVTVINQLGIHARPAVLIVQAAGTFDAEIWLDKAGTLANAKSIMSVMMLAAACGTKIIVRANGKDEDKAVEALAKLFENKFTEA
jgi:phosphocarrier protein HPr